MTNKTETDDQLDAKKQAGDKGLSKQGASRQLDKESSGRDIKVTGLFTRFFRVAMGITVLVMIVMLAGFTIYLDKMALSQAEKRLSLSTSILGPLIETALQDGERQRAQNILLNFIAEAGVVCVDYSSTKELMISQPVGGCAVVKKDNFDFVEMTARPEQGGSFVIIFDASFVAEARNSQIFNITMMTFIMIAIFLGVLGMFFRSYVLAPLANLQDAMTSSKPSKPVLARIFHEDEIGSVSRSFNKLAAASRIYFARLEKSQRKLSESESKFKDMAEISGDWFYEMDADYRLTYVSDRFFEITNASRNQIIGASRRELARQYVDNSHWRAHLADLEAHREFRNFEYLLQVDGGAFMVNISGKPIFNDAGDFRGYRGTGADVTQITNDRKMLEDTNRNFGDSVTYASTIQRSLLVRPETLKEHLGKVASVWQPKDVVGGDFYWIGQIGGSQYLVFFDCTGHGVPGAFMTLITVSVLEKIVAASPMAMPAAQMLEQVHRGVVEQLGITPDKQGHDGLDCGIVKIDRTEGGLEFAGASLDLFAVSKTNQVTRYRGDRLSLGYQSYDKARQFTSHQIPIMGQSFVMITDGLSTQIGEQTKRVLGTRRIIEALENAGSSAPAKLVRTLGMLLKNWQGSEERRDDVTILTFDLMSD